MTQGVILREFDKNPIISKCLNPEELETDQEIKENKVSDQCIAHLHWFLVRK